MWLEAVNTHRTVIILNPKCKKLHNGSHMVTAVENFNTNALSSDTFFLQTLTEQVDTEVTLIAFWKC
jgi:hypothetical protein